METALLFCLICHFGVVFTSVSLDGRQLSDRLKKIRQDIGTNHIQEIYNNLPYTDRIGNGSKLLKEIQTDVESSLSKLTEILTTVQTKILEHEDNFPTSSPLDIPLCCDISEASLTYDPDFRHKFNDKRFVVSNVKSEFDVEALRPDPLDKGHANMIQFNLMTAKFCLKVDFSRACVTKPSISDSAIKYPPVVIGDEMKNYYNNNRNVLWQHYGTKYGTSIIYPATTWNDCQTYDPRFRPEFASTTSPKAKDIVIVIDSSATMKRPSGVPNKTRFVIAKGAARTVIETLNSNDRVAAISFNTDVTKADGCYRDTLSFATKHNQAELKKYVSLLREYSVSSKNFQKALTAAFAYFDMQNSTNAARENIILFVTDGSYTQGDDPRIVIRDKNALLQNKVIVFTYVIGSGLSEVDQGVLRDMASQIQSNSSYGTIKQGQYKYFESDSHKTLALDMATFYLHVNEGIDRQHPTFSIPYVDPFSEVGLMTSMCLPVDVTDGFNGVACTDIKLSKLLSKVEFFDEGNSSYAFMIDKTGRTLVHPLLPDATYMKSSEDPVQVDISVLERSAGSNEIITKMKSGISGSKHLPSVYFTIPRGTLVNDGSGVRVVQGTFFWGNVSNTNFMICIVLGGETHTEISESQFSIPQQDLKNVFLYHERSLTSDSLQNCRFNARLVTLDRTSVKFAPSAFENPFQYTDKAETAEDVNKYTRFFTKETEDNPGFKSNIRPDVWATYELEKYWKTHKSNHLAWRYIGTKSGIMRAYPGVSLTKDYDHEKRPWFRQTISRPNIMYITPPYEDAWGSGILISQEHVIYKKNSKQVTAVLGTDFPLQYFSWFIDQVYPSCSGNEYRCIIIEDSGFIVMHPSFKDSTNKEQFLKSIHITVQEPALAKELTSKSVLNRQECQDLSVNKDLRSFRVTMPIGNINGLNFADTDDQFELKPIPDTNIYIIRQRATSSLSADCTCDKNLNPDVRKCIDACNCLCYNNIQYNVCEHIYSTDGSLPCSARIPDTSGISTPENLTGLRTCFNPQCNTKRNKTACFSEAECGWCEFTDEGYQLQTPCCRLKEDCSFGKTKSGNRNTCDAITTPVPTTIDTEKETTDNSAVIGGASAAAGVVLTLLIVGLICFIRKKRMCEYDDNADPYIHAVPDDRSSGIFDNEATTCSSDSSSNNYTKPPPYVVSSEDCRNPTFNHMDYVNAPK